MNCAPKGTTPVLHGWRAEGCVVWVHFPESRPYKDYRLIRHAMTDPSKFQKIDTQFTIDRPYGSIIA